MDRHQALVLVVLLGAFSHVRADPPANPRNALPAARWTIAFANGVKESCQIAKDGAVSVVEPLRSSLGTAETQERSIVLRFQDDRVERWTPIGARMIVEHWAASAQFPSGAPVLGIGEQAEANDLRMTIRLERQRFRIEEPVVLEIIIKNGGDHEIDLGMSSSDLSHFDLDVRSIGGGMTQAGKMPLTKFGTRILQETPAAKNIPIRLKSGEPRTYRLALSRMVDLTLSGAYSVVMKRSLPGEQQNATVSSNELSFEMAEAASPSR